MSGRQEHLRPLESCTRPYGPTGDFHQFARFTAEELEDQVNQGLRPPQDMIQNLFWAAGPADAGWHWHRAVSTWSFPSLCHKLAHQNNLKDIYAIWQNMPLAMDPPARGHHSAEKGRLKLQRHTAIRKEVKTFAQEMGLKKLPSDVDSWRHLYQEMGKFLAAQSFLTHTPLCVMELPLQQSMTLRPICGRERFVTNGSVSPSAHSRSWSTPSLQPSSAPRRRW